MAAEPGNAHSSAARPDSWPSALLVGFGASTIGIVSSEVLERPESLVVAGALGMLLAAMVLLFRRRASASK